LNEITKQVKFKAFVKESGKTFFNVESVRKAKTKQARVLEEKVDKLKEFLIDNNGICLCIGIFLCLLFMNMFCHICYSQRVRQCLFGARKYKYTEKRIHTCGCNSCCDYCIPSFSFFYCIIVGALAAIFIHSYFVPSNSLVLKARDGAAKVVDMIKERNLKDQKDIAHDIDNFFLQQRLTAKVNLLAEQNKAISAKLSHKNID